jgi:hypothetical protein
MNKAPATTRVDYGPDEPAMQAYFREGEQRALSLPNRGPVHFTKDGRLHPDILASFSHYGFYVLEGLIELAELKDIETDVLDMLDRLPEKKGALMDTQGRPALAVDCTGPTLFWSKPLGDPFGGTELAGGRHPVKMLEPTPPADAPEELVYLILGALQFSEAMLRLYGHPQLLAIAASINGDDFVPFNEAIFIKNPGLGASVAWHQDGVTHWDSPSWDQEIHGFTFQAMLYGCTAANAVWAIPGTHKLGKIDIAAMVQANGSERLPEAVPYISGPGDVVIHNRQLVHGSFANTSPDWRISMPLGFHRRSSVLGVHGGGLHAAPAIFDEVRIRERSRMIGYAIDARRQRFSSEVPFVYQPLADTGETLRWNESAQRNIKDYNVLDFSI